MQHAGALGEEAADLPVAALYFRCRGCCRIEPGVDAGEEVRQLAGAGAGGHDAVLVVAEFLLEQGEVAFAFVLVDLCEQLGLGAAGPGSVPFRRCRRRRA